jgi:hypothetical protein
MDQVLNVGRRGEHGAELLQASARAIEEGLELAGIALLDGRASMLEVFVQEQGVEPGVGHGHADEHQAREQQGLPLEAQETS